MFAHVTFILIFRPTRVDGLENARESYGKTKIFRSTNKLCARPPQYAPATCKLTFDLLTLKVVSESRVTWPTSVPNFNQSINQSINQSNLFVKQTEI